MTNAEKLFSRYTGAIYISNFIKKVIVLYARICFKWTKLLNHCFTNRSQQFYGFLE